MATDSEQFWRLPPRANSWVGSVTMIGSVTLAVSFFIQLTISCMSTAVQIGSWRLTTRELSSTIRGVSMLLTWVARSLGPKIACTSHCGIGEPYSHYPQALMIKEWHYFLTGLFRFREEFPSGWMAGSISALALGQGEGENTIAVFSQDGAPIAARLVEDPEFSPLDMEVAPNGNLVVNSEWPFGAPRAHVTVREYDPSSGQLVRVLSPDASVGFANPRGLRLTTNDRLYCVGKDHVVAYEFTTGRFLGVIAELEGLNGQAVVVLP